MSGWIMAAVGLLSGICASLGIGGGFVLLLYLTAVAAMPQAEAQLLNLLFFLPIGLLSLLLHLRHKLVDRRAVPPALLGGTAGVLLGALLAARLTDAWLSKLFAVFILIVGLRELFSRPGPVPIPDEEAALPKEP